ncbi:putative F-box domain-containing protein [Helianthus annuus]|nr:putative F-box domain-containing protein [Helianthus annuus]
MSSYDLCEELIVEIFSRLPSKSLLRFRSVSKSLRACIGSPDFIRLHALRSPNKVMIIHQVYFQGATRATDMYTLHSAGQLSNDPYVGVTAVEYPFTSFRIVGSCNGVLCLHEYGKGITLWNPSIRRKVTVHDRPLLSDWRGQVHPFGFAFDPIIKDYKIVMTTNCNTKKGLVLRTFVYRMKKDAWHEIASPTRDLLSCRESCQCLFNGTLHWVIKRFLTDSHDDCHSPYILAFNPSSEIFSTIELPEPSWETKEVTIINGSLAVISSKHDDSWIWVRNNTTASWSVAFKLKAHEFEGTHRVFQLTANSDLLFNPCGIIVYNPETRERSSVVRLSASSLVGVTGSTHSLLIKPCIESLGLLDMGTSCDQGKRNRKRSRAYWLL